MRAHHLQLGCVVSELRTDLFAFEHVKAADLGREERVVDVERERTGVERAHVLERRKRGLITIPIAAAAAGARLLALAGIASVALGILLFLFPGPGALALVIWIGAYALVSGVLLTILAFRLRSWAHDSTVPHGTPHAHAH